VSEIVLVDGRWLCVGHDSGRVWTEQVLRHLGGVMAGARIDVAVREGHQSCVAGQADNVWGLPSSLGGPVWADQLGDVANLIGATVLLCQYSCSRTAVCPQVAVIHDLLFEDYPQHFTDAQIEAFRETRSRINKAAAVIAVSEYTRNRLGALGYLEGGRPCSVVISGSDHIAVPSHCGHHHVPARRRYVVQVGRVTDRKNLSLIVEAMHETLWPSELQLLVVGELDGKHDRSLAALDVMCRGGLGWYAGRVSDHCLNSIVAQSDGLLYVSSAEGFGLPVIEALRLGAPVFCSDVPAAREVVPDYVHIINPTTAAALANKVAAVYHGAERARAKLDPKSLPTWHQTAGGVASALRSCVR